MNKKIDWLEVLFLIVVFVGLAIVVLWPLGLL